ncbi:predicted protein [Postia placenta Mad-698-R]|nr:predicted protein [Postia placenta Mad-698-R]
MVFRASSFSEACRYARAYLHTVRGDLHVLWDRGDILIAPMPDVVNKYMDKYKDGERHDILEVIGKKKIHSSNSCRELWVKGLEEFYERIHLKIDASRFVENILRVNAMWTAPPPGEAQLVRKQKLPMNIPTGVPRTPERPKDRKPEACKSNGEQRVNTLKSQVAQLAPTGSRCLLTNQEDRSVQGCHVVPRRTDNRLRKRLAAWWGLKDFDIDTPFNLFLLRADIHSLWDKGHIIFVPEPQILDEYRAQSRFPIVVGAPLDKPFRVCNGPLYKYCVIAHRGLPRSEEDSDFPRALDTVGCVVSRVPPQFVTYNAGLALSKGDGPEGFEPALDAFYKEHNIQYEAINVLADMKGFFDLWSTDTDDAAEEAFWLD